MAPARMISFIEQHAANCVVCQKDPDIHDEVAKITEIVLPESKIPKAIRSSQLDEDDIDDLEDVGILDDEEEDVGEEEDEDLDEDLSDDDLDDESDLLDPEDL